jgi:phosphate-selective porin OprO/OprP
MQTTLTRSLLTLVVAIGVLSLPTPAAVADVTDDILEILRDSGEISEEKHDELSRKAEEEKNTALRAYWKDGIRLETRDKKFKFKIGGRMQVDWGILGLDGETADALELDKIETGVEIRRARLYLSGTIYEIFDFKTQYDFAEGDNEFKDVWMALNRLPAVNLLKIGHFKEPFSLEALTSSKHITFLERAVPNVYAPDRNTGIAVYDTCHDGRMTWVLGGFRETDDFGNGFGGDSLYNLTTRVTGLPWYEEDGRRLVHLGLSYSHKFRNNDEVSFRQRPEGHLIDARPIDASVVSDGVDLINPEAALVLGPFSLQAEYAHTFINATEMSDVEFSGLYIYGSYFLTGENRVYKDKNGAFANVKPRRNFMADGENWGAWEVALRYSNVDQDDSGVQGGQLHGITTGLNWYLNPNMRVTVNYSYFDVHRLGDGHYAGGRFQLAL